MLCYVGMLPGLLRPDGMHRLEVEFISVDLYSFLECQTTSAFPATEVIGSRGLGYCKAETPEARCALRQRGLLWNDTDLGFVVDCNMHVKLCVRST